MNLDKLIVPTAVATPGMTIEALFRECVDKQVPGIPFRDARGHLSGKASIRHVMKVNCIPDDMVRHASLLGDRLESLRLSGEKASQLMKLSVDAFVLPDSAWVSREASVAKALAVMERYDTTYLFVVDGDDYAGCVSIMGIGAGILAQVTSEQG